jgi:sucrose phosphorylase
VYDFALPLLIVHAFYFKTAESLKYWMAICPRRQITVLDTHDGMGIDDIQVRCRWLKTEKCVLLRP